MQVVLVECRYNALHANVPFNVPCLVTVGGLELSLRNATIILTLSVLYIVV
jgi:hypothetical protein